MKTLWMLTLLLLVPFAQAEQKDPDPWEGFNRKMFAFNDFLDRNALRPAAQAYQYVTPKDVDDSVTNFFSNLDDVLVIVNDVAQLKFGQAASDLGRFLINSTVGFFGVFDVASHIGLRKHDEDFGQTLGYWGVGSGPYLMLPVLGPSTVRDTVGTGMSWATSLGPTSLGDDLGEQAGIYIVDGVDARAGLLASEGLISGDRYVFIRSLYLQRREYLVNDGVVEDDFSDFDDMEDDNWDEDWDEEDDWGEDWDKEPAPGEAEAI